MGTSINQMAPLLVVLALAGYCCWSESDDPAAEAAKANAAKLDLTPALLSPAATPAPARNPFPSLAEKKKASASKGPLKEEPLLKMDLAKCTGHLVLRATLIHGDRRLAMINNKFYGEGDSLPLLVNEPSSEAATDKTKPANPIKTALPLCQVARVLADRVVLECADQSVELKFPLADKRKDEKNNAKSSPDSSFIPHPSSFRVQGGK